MIIYDKNIKFIIYLNKTRIKMLSQHFICVTIYQNVEKINNFKLRIESHMLIRINNFEYRNLKY